MGFSDGRDRIRWTPLIYETRSEPLFTARLRIIRCERLDGNSLGEWGGKSAAVNGVTRIIGESPAPIRADCYCAGLDKDITAESIGFTGLVFLRITIKNFMLRSLLNGARLLL